MPPNTVHSSKYRKCYRLKSEKKRGKCSNEKKICWKQNIKSPLKYRN